MGTAAIFNMWAETIYSFTVNSEISREFYFRE